MWTLSSKKCEVTPKVQIIAIIARGRGHHIFYAIPRNVTTAAAATTPNPDTTIAAMLLCKNQDTTPRPRSTAPPITAQTYHAPTCVDGSFDRIALRNATDMK